MDPWTASNDEILEHFQSGKMGPELLDPRMTEIVCAMRVSGEMQKEKGAPHRRLILCALNSSRDSVEVAARVLRATDSAGLALSFLVREI